jgi:hypothetical protein
MSYTLANYAAETESVSVKGVIAAMLSDGSGGGSNLLSMMPIAPISTLRPTFWRQINEGDVNGVGSRPINGAYPEGTGSTVPETIQVGNIGGRYMIDNTFLRSKEYVQGADPKVLQASMKSALIKRTANDRIVNGDLALNPNSWNGLRKYITSGQIVNVTDFGSFANGLDVKASTANGEAYIEALVALVNYISDLGSANNVLVMNYHAKQKLRAVCLKNGYFEITKDQYDRTVETFMGLPILNPGAKNPVEEFGQAINSANMVLPNTRTYGTATNACEIWAMRLSAEDGCALWEYQPLTTYEVMRTDQADVFIGEISWELTFYPLRKDAIAVLRGCIVV